MQEKIKDVPMLTVDGVEIKKGTKLYVADVEKAEWDDKIGKRVKLVKVHEYEVIYANPTTRKFKILKEDKTESDFGMFGRAIKEFFGKRPNAAKVAKKEIRDHLKELQEQSKSLNKLIEKYKKRSSKNLGGFNVVS